MKKEPSKTQENGISDTGIPMPDDILLRLVKEKDAGKEYMAAIREKLMRLLKEYLGQKYGRKVRFILPTRPEKSTTRKSTSQMTTCCPCAER